MEPTLRTVLRGSRRTRLSIVSHEPDNVLADEKHMWGPTSFHYVDAAYYQFGRGHTNAVSQREESGKLKRPEFSGDSAHLISTSSWALVTPA